MTTLLSLQPDPDDGDDGLGRTLLLLFDDVNEIDGGGQADDDDDDDIDAADVFSSFDDAFSISDFIIADGSLMLLISLTMGILLAGSVGRPFFEVLGCSVSWDGDDNADLPQAVGEIIERVIILVFS